MHFEPHNATGTDEHGYNNGSLGITDHLIDVIGVSSRPTVLAGGAPSELLPRLPLKEVSHRGVILRPAAQRRLRRSGGGVDDPVHSL